MSGFAVIGGQSPPLHRPLPMTPPAGSHQAEEDWMRLLVRPDMDGLTCAVMLKRVEEIEEVVFVEPQVLKNGRVDVTSQDIIANLPWDARCGMWFDHHISNAPPEGTPHPPGRFAIEPSAARVIYDHYGSEHFDDLMILLEDTDRVDSATLTREDVLNPQGYVLVAMTVDASSGLEVSEAYLHRLVKWLEEDDIETLLARPEVATRVERLLKDQATYRAFLLENSHQEGKVVITDMRNKAVPAGNRFLVYTLFPEANVAMRIYDPKDLPDRVAISLGHSIFNRTCEINVGELLARYGGGGHRGAGSSRIQPERANQVRDELLDALRQED